MCLINDICTTIVRHWSGDEDPVDGMVRGYQDYGPGIQKL